MRSTNPVSILDDLGLHVLELDETGQVVRASASVPKLIDRPLDEIIGGTANSLIGIRAEDDEDTALVMVAGRKRYIEMTSHVGDRDRCPSTVLTLLRDVTEERREKALHASLTDIERRILAGDPPAELLERACVSAVEVFDAALVWIGSCELDGTVSVRAKAGHATGYLDVAHESLDNLCRPGGAIARSLSDATPHSVDLLSGEGSEFHRVLAVGFGLRHVLAFPLNIAGECRGAMVVMNDSEITSEGSRLGLQQVADHVSLVISQGFRHALSHLYDAALEAIPAAVYVLDPTGLILWTNQQLRDVSGYRSEELVGRNASMLVAGVESHRKYCDTWRELETSGQWSGERHNLSKEGVVHLVAETIQAVHDASGRLTHYVATQLDLAERIEREQRIQYLMDFDPLTRLPNRHQLEGRLDDLLRSEDAQASVILLLDIDHFSLINDIVGHASGDRALVSIAHLLRHELDSEHFLARWGGDEFAVLLEGASLDEGRVVATRLQDAVAGYRVRLEGQQLSLSATVGVAAADPGQASERVLAAADAALYRARRLGAGKLRVARDLSRTRPPNLSDGHWATRIRDAINLEQMVLHFQPVVRLEDEQTVHFEALVRMVEESGELIMPGEFIPAAERFGVMPQLDAWVLRESLRVLREHPAVNMFVNVSGMGLGDPEHLAELETILSKAALAPGRLTLEITETAAVEDLHAASQWMRNLSELGCRFALDDFGKGFSTFSYLADLPVDFVKIDGSFVRDIETDRKNRALVEAIASVANTLDKRVIAECVEGAETARILKQLGVAYGQGYLWGRAEESFIGV